MPEDPCGVEALSVLSRFRIDFYDALWNRRDELFELTDALLCADGPVKSLVDLVLAPEHRRGHGAMYDAVNSGYLDVDQLRRSLAGLSLPRAAGGLIVLAVDVSPWLRSDAGSSPERLFCHIYGRGRNSAQLIPGWPYSFVAALETGRHSWTAILDAVRLGPADDTTAITATQLRGVVERLIAAGQYHAGEPRILIVIDAGYDIPRLAYVLADLPVELLGRLRSDRVMRLPAPPRCPGHRRPTPSTQPKLSTHRPDDLAHPIPDHHAPTPATTAQRPQPHWNRVHPRLTHRSCWLDHNGALPTIEGTLMRLQVEHLPNERHPKPVWLWFSTTHTPSTDVDHFWQTFLRRFDLEHTFRFPKQTLGRTRPQPPRPDSRRPLDLDRHRRPHPAPARPSPHRRPPPTLGETRRARSPHPDPSPPWV